MPNVRTDSSQSSPANGTRVDGQRRTRRFWLPLVLFLVDSFAAYALALYSSAAAQTRRPQTKRITGRRVITAEVKWLR
jgi:hypothetical protein